MVILITTLYSDIMGWNNYEYHGHGQGEEEEEEEEVVSYLTKIKNHPID